MSSLWCLHEVHANHTYIVNKQLEAIGQIYLGYRLGERKSLEFNKQKGHKI